jgi:hypothetical protein
VPSCVISCCEFTAASIWGSRSNHYLVVSTCFCNVGLRWRSTTLINDSYASPKFGGLGGINRHLIFKSAILLRILRSSATLIKFCSLSEKTLAGKPLRDLNQWKADRKAARLISKTGFRSMHFDAVQRIRQILTLLTRVGCLRLVVNLKGPQKSTPMLLNAVPPDV